ncbi:MAG TPA: ATP-dependent zinc metalloprotease FtsH [Erysipelotrichaceae bacterium]|jgi:cell division protease FtsH|nr:ATP-dependent zinc metalloprotease FtsH [Erysipelotrichaceae bacterium]HQA85772.1 ATP-dependent zinc metalloprotease FtsH [Erysipelotrichaceae bacterium]
MEEKKSSNRNRISRTLLYYYSIAMLAIFLFNWLFVPMYMSRQVQTTSYSDFIAAVEAGDVEQVHFTDTQINYTKEKDGKIYYFKTGIVDNPSLPQLLQEKGVSYGAEIPEKPNEFLSLFLNYGVPILIFSLIGRRIRKNMAGKLGASGLNIRSREVAKVYTPDDDKKTFKDVAGQEEAKEALKEIIDYLNNPGKYEKIGAKCPKGVLLVGPPGTGKTLMAKAVAGEADVPFFSISGSEFVEMFVGRGAARVRELFDQANKKAPCIVFIDEIDTIGKKRDTGLASNDEREQTLNQLLTEMDGFEGNKGVIILAATNRPDVLDPALLRPGRFDRQVRVELPDLKGREAILEVHLKKIKTEKDIDINLVARMTAGASGAQLANIVNEAALRAVRMNSNLVTTEDLVESVEIIIAGAERKNAILSEEEKRIVAYHEIGHALVAAKQSGSAPVQKITIVPRTSGALGYTMQVEEEEKSLYSKTDAYQKLEVLCGGRAAEEIIFNIVTTGASNDIERATEIARNMVTRYGMSETFGMMALQTGGNSYLGDSGRMTCSSETARLVDEEVRNIIARAHNNAKKILEDNKEKMDELADYLIDKETITGQEFMNILEN